MCCSKAFAKCYYRFIKQMQHSLRIFRFTLVAVRESGIEFGFLMGLASVSVQNHLLKAGIVVLQVYTFQTCFQFIPVTLGNVARLYLINLSLQCKTSGEYPHSVVVMMIVAIFVLMQSSSSSRCWNLGLCQQEDFMMAFKQQISERLLGLRFRSKAPSGLHTLQFHPSEILLTRQHSIDRQRLIFLVCIEPFGWSHLGRCHTGQIGR